MDVTCVEHINARNLHRDHVFLPLPRSLRMEVYKVLHLPRNLEERFLCRDPQFGTDQQFELLCGIWPTVASGPLWTRAKARFQTLDE